MVGRLHLLLKVGIHHYQVFGNLSSNQLDKTGASGSGSTVNDSAAKFLVFSSQPSRFYSSSEFEPIVLKKHCAFEKTKKKIDM